MSHQYLKKGIKVKQKKYRPISLTSVPGKILERCIRDAIVDHITSNNLFSISQHGFIRGRSCVTQVRIHGIYNRGD